MKTITRSKHALNTLIFKSNISTSADVAKVHNTFSQLKCIKRWAVDLDDWEHVLKVESDVLSCDNITAILESIGIECSELNH
ncbi:hypothetical protein [Ekhidna sp.]|uniref:hypothetical protein n=1 Tax=Ekhidna sp. TaxID=2608089 RepID=UPI003B5111F0